MLGRMLWEVARQLSSVPAKAASFPFRPTDNNQNLTTDFVPLRQDRDGGVIRDTVVSLCPAWSA
jgi:hypothetical protein